MCRASIASILLNCQYLCKCDAHVLGYIRWLNNIRGDIKMMRRQKAQIHRIMMTKCGQIKMLDDLSSTITSDICVCIYKKMSQW